KDLTKVPLPVYRWFLKSEHLVGDLSAHCHIIGRRDFGPLTRVVCSDRTDKKGLYTATLFNRNDEKLQLKLLVLD
ncbi:hypothetical protein GGF39_002410, partial [Coemansia sp. RSA 1721]